MVLNQVVWKGFVSLDKAYVPIYMLKMKYIFEVSM